MSSRYNKFGVALILVTFILALAMILVNNLAYSTFLSSRTTGVIQRQLQSEYILKSLLNYAKAIIEADTTSGYDIPSDSFGMYTNGIQIPPALLGIGEENMEIDLEIRPVNSRFNLRKQSGINLATITTTPLNSDAHYLVFLLNLFEKLGFDTDNSTHKFGKYKGINIDSAQMVGNLIDYQDADTNNFNHTITSTGSLNKGTVTITGNFDSKEFKNKAVDKISELQNIPGFTPERISRLSEFVTFEGESSVNINFVPSFILESLEPSLFNQNVYKNISDYKETFGGFKNIGDFQAVVPGFPNPRTGVSFSSNRYKVLGKIAYGEKAFYLDAVIDKSTGKTEIIQINFY